MSKIKETIDNLEGKHDSLVDLILEAIQVGLDGAFIQTYKTMRQDHDADFLSKRSAVLLFMGNFHQILHDKVKAAKLFTEEQMNLEKKKKTTSKIPK